MPAPSLSGAPRVSEVHTSHYVIKSQPASLSLHPYPLQGQRREGPKPLDPTGHLALTKYSIISVGPIQPPPPPPGGSASTPCSPAESNPTQQPMHTKSSFSPGSCLLLTSPLSWALASSNFCVLPAVPRSGVHSCSQVQQPGQGRIPETRKKKYDKLNSIKMKV